MIPRNSMFCVSILLIVVVANASARIASSQQLLGSIIDNCLDGNGMQCVKGELLDYLNTVSGAGSIEESRSLENVDELIFNRVSKILKENDFKVKMGGVVASYTHQNGFDVKYDESNGEGRDILKKKLLLPILLLLKLKMKAIMPILVAIVGLKATKALILSKLAITLVLGFLIVQLIMKKSAMNMAMMMTPAAMEPMTAYGPPPATSTVATPDNAYGPPGWDSGNSYSRVWEPSVAASAQDYSYSSYYPSSKNANPSSGSSSPSSSSSSTSSSSASSATSTAHAY